MLPHLLDFAGFAGTVLAGVVVFGLTVATVWGMWEEDE